MTEINKEIPTRGKYTKIALQATTDFQNKKIKTAKLDITYIDEQELNTLYDTLKSLIRRRKIPIRATLQKNKTANRHEIYLIRENP